MMARPEFDGPKSLGHECDGPTSHERKLAELYQAAKDENELLEFKNYELQFKIQELEQRQQKMMCKFSASLSNDRSTVRQDNINSQPEECLTKLEGIGNNQATDEDIRKRKHDHYIQNDGTVKDDGADEDGTRELRVTRRTTERPVTPTTILDAVSLRRAPIVCGNNRKLGRDHNGPVLCSTTSLSLSLSSSSSSPSASPNFGGIHSIEGDSVSGQCSRAERAEKEGEEEEEEAKEDENEGEKEEAKGEIFACASASAFASAGEWKSNQLHESSGAVDATEAAAARQAASLASLVESNDADAASLDAASRRRPRDSAGQERPLDALSRSDARHLAHDENMSRVWSAIAATATATATPTPTNTTGNINAGARKANNCKRQQQAQQISGLHERRNDGCRPNDGTNGQPVICCHSNKSLASEQTSMDCWTAYNDRQLIEYNGCNGSSQAESGSTRRARLLADTGVGGASDRSWPEKVMSAKDVDQDDESVVAVASSLLRFGQPVSLSLHLKGSSSSSSSLLESPLDSSPPSLQQQSSQSTLSSFAIDSSIDEHQQQITNNQHDSIDSSGSLSTSSTNMKPPTAMLYSNGLRPGREEVGRKLAGSQPNLSASSGPQAAGRSRCARIAVPVPRRLQVGSVKSASNQLQSQQQQKQQKSPNPHPQTRSVSNQRRQTTRSVTNALGARSKSSLGQSSGCLSAPQASSSNSFSTTNLARRIDNSASKFASVVVGQQQQQQQQRQSTLGLCKPQTNHHDQEPFSGSRTGFAGGKSAQSSLLSARLQNRSKSSSSLGFVTQIPTLISQSHASGVHKSGKQEQQQHQHQQQALPVARLSTLMGASGSDCSKSMSNLLPSESLLEEQTVVAFAGGAAKEAIIGEACLMSNDDHEQAKSCGGDELASELEAKSKRSLSEAKNRDKTGQSCSLLPTALKAEATRKLDEIGQVNDDDGDDDDDIVTVAGAAVNGLDTLASKSHETLAAAPSKLPARCCTATDQAPNSAATNNNGQEQQQQQQRECAQCKVMQSKLNTLIEDRRKLDEQISELEEMENDSRLMSQKLTQQNVQLERQLEACKLELQKTCLNESRLHFQNKRLNFELRQRFECLQLHQSQLAKLQAQASLAKNCLSSENDKQQNNTSAEVAQVVPMEPNAIVVANNGVDSSHSGREKSANKTIAQSMCASAKRCTDTERQQKQKHALQELASSATNSDDDSAIEMFALSGKRQEEAGENKSAGSEQNTLACKEKAQEQQVKTSTNEAQCQTVADDSAYSKSSASSDSNSDDGHRSDSEQAVSETSDVLGLVSESSGEGTAARELLAVESESLQRAPNRASSSSSGDESDHHEAQSSCALASSLSSIDQAIQQQQQQQQQIACLTGRQQVLRKKISVARILRGIQVQQSTALVLPTTNNQIMSTTTTTTTTTTTSTTTNNSIKSPSVNLSRTESGNDCVARQEDQLGQVARLVQVLTEPANGASSGEANNQADQSAESRIEMARDNNQQQQQQQSQAIGIGCGNNQALELMRDTRDKNPIDLALAGIDDLERGRGVDEALRSLINGNQPPPVGGFGSVRARGSQVAAPTQQVRINLAAHTQKGFDHIEDHTSDTSENYSLAQHETQISKINEHLNRFRREIRDLKMRLVQSHTLNDNLLNQLQSSKDRFEQLKQQQQQRSIVYVNGGSANHTACLMSGGTSGAPSGQQQNGICSNSVQPNNCCCLAAHQYSDGNNNHQTACVERSELVNYLRFLSEKLHYHHGRTFELVNECQKLAMNALLVGYNHQMNLAHHNGAVLAGNQATDRQSQQSQNPIDLYPVRPPPRRRSAANRMLSPEQNPCDQKSPTSAHLAQSKHRYSEKTTVQQATNGAACNNPLSALQVAKQTLFSIVPIYHNSNTKTGYKNDSKPTNRMAESENNQAFVSANDTYSEAVIHSSSSIMDMPQSKRWLVPNQQQASTNGQVNRSRESVCDYQNHYDARRHTTTTATAAVTNVQVNQQQQQNISILEINRSSITAKRNQQQQQQQPRAFPQTMHHYQQPYVASHHLIKVKDPLSENIERYRVHFNGQLLDLLTRQNWCESIVAEKLKYYHQAADRFSQTRQMQSKSFAPNESHVKVMETIQDKNASVRPTEMPINSISLNPNGLANQRQAVVQAQLHNRQSWPSSQEGNESSFC